VFSSLVLRLIEQKFRKNLYGSKPSEKNNNLITKLEIDRLDIFNFTGFVVGGASDLVIGDDHESPQADELPQNIFVSAASQSECSDAVKHYQQTDEFSPFEKFTFSLFAPHFFSLSQGRQLDFSLFMSRRGIVIRIIFQTASVSQLCSVYPTNFLLFPSFYYFLHLIYFRLL
jgi:hypothetical protein